MLEVDITEIVSRIEPLHPDLAARVISTEIGPILHHPLIVTYLPHPALANVQYAQKLEALDAAIKQQDWNTYVWLHERPYRADALRAIVDNLNDDDYWGLVSSVWVDSENVWENQDTWIRLLTARQGKPGDDISELPDVLTIYRGAIEGMNEDGLSWTLDRNLAIWFAKRLARATDCPVLLTATVAKRDVDGYFTNRNESEIVITDMDCLLTLAVEAL